MYNIVRHKGDTIASVMESSPPNVMFRRDLHGVRLVSWNALLRRLELIHLTAGRDVFRWKLHENGIFSVSSMYNALIQPKLLVDNNRKIWKMKIPLKTKKIAWYLRREKVSHSQPLMKDSSKS